MALNRKYTLGEPERVTPLIKCRAADANDTPNLALAGDPVVIGVIPGVALKDADADFKAPVQLNGVFELTVDGIDNSGALGADANSAVDGGDAIYFNEGDDPPLSKRADGILFGYALGDEGVEIVAAGASGSVNVMVGKA